MKLLPVGKADFEALRTPNAQGNDFVYVDKTALIYQLVTEQTYVFVSRPRRFGKSLLISTLECLFQGKQQLFEGLWIENRWHWAVRYPVIRLDLNNLKMLSRTLPDAMAHLLKKQARQLGVTLEEVGADALLEEMIEALYQRHQQKVVVLID